MQSWFVLVQLRRVSAMGALLSLLAMATSLRADEKLSLRLADAAGDSWTFDRTSDMDLTSKITVGNGPTQTTTSKRHQRRVGKLEILAVQNGWPTSVRLCYAKECENVVELNGQTQEAPFAFAGETLTLTKRADGSIQSDFRGQADPESVAEAKKALAPDTGLYPETPVAIGDKWKGNAQAVARQLDISGPKDSGEMTMKLLSLKEVAGRATAEVQVTSEASKEVQGFTRKTATQGIALIDVRSGHVVKFELKGTTALAGTTMTVRCEDEGTMTLSMASEPSGGGMNTGGPGTTDGPKPSTRPRPASRPATQASAGNVMWFETYILKDDPTYIGREESRGLYCSHGNARSSYDCPLLDMLCAAVGWRTIDSITAR